jgi:hypothetical protein
VRVASWVDRLAEVPGSTRGVALMRIGIVLVAWAELGAEAAPRAAGWPLALFFYASTAAMLVGVRAQLATLAAAAATWIAIYKLPGTMHHHTYLMAVAMSCLALTPCGRSFSVDRWRAVRAGEAPEERGNLWALRLIGLQLSAVFFWGGYNKLTLGTQSFQVGFLSGDRLEQTILYYHSLPAHSPNWITSVFALMGTGITLFELFCGIGLWLPQTRKWCLVGCLVMTTSFQILLNVGTFGVLAAVLYVSFVPPERVHRLVDELLA